MISPFPSRATPVIGCRESGTLLSWLLDGPAQISRGPHAGAVAGCVDLAGNAIYVYPEIAGYYLQWLVWRARTGVDPAMLAVRAAGAKRWLGVWLADREPPRTRIHLDHSADWRNDALFFFDLAMVLRGLASATREGLLTHDAVLVTKVVRHLEYLIAPDGLFDACREIDPGIPTPERWSTRRGAFLAKAAAGVIVAARAFPALPECVERAALATFDASVDALFERPHSQLHPMLYAFEGILSLPGHPRFRAILPELADRFDILLGSMDTKGWLPETLTSCPERRGPARVDVVAQALRVGCLLERHRRPGTGDQVTLARLRQLLERAVQSSGAVPFTAGTAVTYWNTWAAMFADQALAFAGNDHREFDALADPLLI